MSVKSVSGVVMYKIAGGNEWRRITIPAVAKEVVNKFKGVAITRV